MTSIDENHTIKRRGRRSPTKSRPARRSTATHAAPASETIKTLPVAWIGNPPLIAPDAPVPAWETVEASNAFHAPAVIRAPTPRPAFAQIRFAVTQALLLTAAATRQLWAGFAHWYRPGVRNALPRWIRRPSLIGANVAASASESIAVSNVFHAPVVISAPSGRSALVRIRAAVARVLFVTATAASQAIAVPVRWCGFGIRTTMQPQITRLSLTGPDAAVSASEVVAVSNVFHAPAVMSAPSHRSAFAQVLAAITRRLLLTVAAAKGTMVGLMHWCGLGIRTAMQQARRVDARAAVSSFGRWLARLIFVATRAIAMIVCCLAFYAAIVLAPASPDPAIDRPAPPTSANVTTVGVASAAITPSPARPKPVDAKAPASQAPSNQASSNVKIVNAPQMNATCQEQTWPYITQRCLAAGNGKVDNP